MASNSSNFYVLKYRIKHALEEDKASVQKLSENDKQILRQAQKECKYIDYAYYLYTLLDVGITFRNHWKTYRHNSHTFNKVL